MRLSGIAGAKSTIILIAYAEWVVQEARPVESHLTNQATGNDSVPNH